MAGPLSFHAKFDSVST